jgi:hypothetical protein
MKPTICREPHDETRPDVLDYETAMLIMGDIESRSSWSTPFVLAQWVAKIRKYERNVK